MRKILPSLEPESSAFCGGTLPLSYSGASILSLQNVSLYVAPQVQVFSHTRMFLFMWVPGSLD